ncbi:MAG: DNA mismatch endonuclease Vsr [Saprospiraceae bacterium]|nr:DNA mismatch endonuclease Vsr [Saprospiraceae bacterium]
MADVHNKETRSFNMSRIRSQDTKPEMLVRKFLFANGFRYRIHVKSLPGNPDIVLPKYKAVIFINGCFWHGHTDCKYFVVPKTRTEFWLSKIQKNISNDFLNHNKLEQEGYTVIIIWECEVKNKSIFENLVQKIKSPLNLASN